MKITCFPLLGASGFLSLAAGNLRAQAVPVTINDLGFNLTTPYNQRSLLGAGDQVSANSAYWTGSSPVAGGVGFWRFSAAPTGPGTTDPFNILPSLAFPSAQHSQDGGNFAVFYTPPAWANAPYIQQGFTGLTGTPGTTYSLTFQLANMVMGSAPLNSFILHQGTGAIQVDILGPDALSVVHT